MTAKRHVTEEASSPSKRTASSFFQKRPRQHSPTGSWTEVGQGQLLHYSNQATHPTTLSNKIAAFDLDGTLIRVKGRHVHPRDRHDWEFWDASIPSRLRTLVQEGFNIVILSNQGGLRRKKDGTRNAREVEWRAKITAIVSELDIPIQVLGAIGYGVYRKPCPGMWRHIIGTPSSEERTVDFSKSFYVGDAAGREKGWKEGALRGDHSAADRKLALNIGLAFYTPEEYFHNEAVAPYNLGKFDPTKPKGSGDDALEKANRECIELIISGGKGLVLLVGAPASGKSTVGKAHFEPRGYTRINMDTLKTKARCLKGCKEALAKNGRVIVDNTNGDKATRAEYLRIAKALDLPCHVLWVKTEPEICRHNNLYRSMQPAQRGSEEYFGGHMRLQRDRIPDVAFRTFYSRFQPPSLAEGFTSIHHLI
ncbi:MAG: polynucleotide kinase 3 phosphatase-domain-containing protein [Piptocephalis tieghemiana]|nr:MAG: polynucleotide kinase 3 phosphatase-domain-containing protein [Piptocephalis tieghemiana]